MGLTTGLLMTASFIVVPLGVVILEFWLIQRYGERADRRERLARCARKLGVTWDR